MTLALQQLITEARWLGGEHPCAVGCKWVTEGGRGCPQSFNDNCGQAVYKCEACGAYDYGEPGGPGAADCAVRCPGPEDWWHDLRKFGPPQESDVL